MDLYLHILLAASLVPLLCVLEAPGQLQYEKKTTAPYKKQPEAPGKPYGHDKS